MPPTKVDLTIRVAEAAKANVIRIALEESVSQGEVLRAMLAIATQHMDAVLARIRTRRDQEA